MSNYPIEKKTADFRHYINRLISLQLKGKGKYKMWANIFTTGRNNGFSSECIIKINE